jgi:hypothetical protein
LKRATFFSPSLLCRLYSLGEGLEGKRHNEVCKSGRATILKHRLLLCNQCRHLPDFKKPILLMQWIGWGSLSTGCIGRVNFRNMLLGQEESPLNCHAPIDLLSSPDLQLRSWLIQKNYFSIYHFFASSLLFRHFFLSNNISTSPRTILLLYNDLKRRIYGNPLPSRHLIHLCLPFLIFAFGIIAPYFHSWSNGLATNISSLASGPDGHLVRLGIEYKGFDLYHWHFRAVCQLSPPSFS